MSEKIDTNKRKGQGRSKGRPLIYKTEEEKLKSIKRLGQKRRYLAKLEDERSQEYLKINKNINCDNTITFN